MIDSLIANAGLWAFILILTVWAVVSGLCFGFTCTPRKKRKSDD
jgi:hypothetical protein